MPNGSELGLATLDKEETEIEIEAGVARGDLAAQKKSAGSV